MTSSSIAINGFGRIGRGVLRALYESDFRQHLRVTLINELADIQTIAHLLKYDSVHGRFAGEVSVAGNKLIISYNNYRDEIAVTHQAVLPALELTDPVDLLLECSGVTPSQDVNAFLNKHTTTKILFSRPMLQDEVDATIVFGFNHETLSAQHRIISAGSCTTNAIVPLINILHERFGVSYGSSTTIHSLMNDQPVLDAYHHTDLRKTRAASHSMIPVETALAKGIERLLPAFKGRFSSQALRVPVLNVSAIDVSLTLDSATDVNAVNACLQQASESYFKHVLAYNDEPLASSDFIHRAESGIIDASQTRMSGDKLLKVWVWFDNEWGYAHRMLDIASWLPKLS